MITLIRWIILQQKKIKLKLALVQFIDQQMTNIIKHPEEIEKKILPYLAQVIHDSNRIITDIVQNK